ncbi:response regulator [Paraburkholderia sp. UCT70]|uniref:response regulator n=1 Tax=Paraburkholderia sp. UCT70 TaxID=2991068 RepID=UPI003D1D0657
MIADEHGVIRDVLRRLFADAPYIDVVADAGDGHATLAACRAHRPGIVVMELQLPSLDGIDTIRTIRRRWRDTRILVLSAMTTEIRVAEALNAGAQGYVLKRSSSGTLLGAILALRASQQYIDAALNLDQIESMRRQTIKVGAHVTSALLTTRERQVLKLIAEGGRNRDIAERLTISLKTVETHRLNMMQKLDARNIAELVRWAHRLGIAPL